MSKNNLFLVNNALNVNKLSVYDNNERFLQTLTTVESIKKYGPPKSRVVMFDNSIEKPDQRDKIQELERRGVEFMYYGDVPMVKSFSIAGNRSAAECAAFSTLLRDLKGDIENNHRIYKLSGRYCLNKNFVMDAPEYDGAFVFANALDSWMTDIQKRLSGVSKLYRLRLWHMDGSLINIFRNELNTIFQDCLQYGIDVEHAYYKYLHKYKVVEVDKIGVQGNIAPSGEWVDE